MRQAHKQCAKKAGENTCFFHVVENVKPKSNNQIVFLDRHQKVSVFSFADLSVPALFLSVGKA